MYQSISDIEPYLRTLHVDGTLLELGPEEEAFFKIETGIQDTEELKEHIIKVHQGAHEASDIVRLYAFIGHNLTGGCLGFRSIRFLVYVGSHPRCSRSPGTLHTRASSG